MRVSEIRVNQIRVNQGLGVLWNSSSVVVKLMWECIQIKKFD